MGAKLGKNIPILKNTNGHEKEVITSSNETSTLEKKSKKKKEKSSNIKVDKYTSTDGSVISSSTYIKQLVVNSESNDAQVNSINHSETPSKDVLELRDACIRRGIISPETNTVILPTSLEQDQQENTTDTVKETTDETATTVVTNNEQIQNEQQVES